MGVNIAFILATRQELVYMDALLWACLSVRPITQVYVGFMYLFGGYWCGGGWSFFLQA